MADRASPCGIIDITTGINAGQTATITSVLSDFELVGVSVSGDNGVIATVKKNGTTAAVAYRAGSTNGNLDSSTQITNANASFAAADALTIEITQANATRVTIFTRYPDAYADILTVVVA
ncbi:MAG: hypothetical protein CMD33_01060 [Flavobacteriales bacterium]|nr:hypothetical protein [Flavobacteriales bacterium]